MTQKGTRWTDEQRLQQSMRMRKIAAERSPADRRLSALRGHATRAIRDELKARIEARKESTK